MCNRITESGKTLLNRRPRLCLRCRQLYPANYSTDFASLPRETRTHHVRTLVPNATKMAIKAEQQTLQAVIQILFITRWGFLQKREN